MLQTLLVLQIIKSVQDSRIHTVVLQRIDIKRRNVTANTGMVLDVWTTPTGPPNADDIYILERYPANDDNDDFCRSQDVWLLGIFDCLEAALHALDHVSKYDTSTMQIDLGCRMMIYRMPRNTVRGFRHQLVSWKRGPDVALGVPSGIFKLHDGLRTHSVEVAT